MPRKQYQYHYIYKTTCKENNRFYIGMHSTDNLEDDYIGSGKQLWYSIKKYGRGKHEKEILEFLPDRKSLSEREKEMVNTQLLKEPLCMNLCEGGEGGLKHDLNKKIWEDQEFRERHSIKMKKMHADGKFKIPNWKGRKHSEESKLKIGKMNSIKQQGEKNSQYGTRWINDGYVNKKIKKEDDIPNGWCLGQIKKNN